MNNKKPMKIDNLSIKFLTKNTQLYTLFQPFLYKKYDEIFFQEKIVEGYDFSLYIVDEKVLLKLYNLLERFDKLRIIYKLVYTKKEEDPDEYPYYFWNEINYTLDELRGIEIEKKSFPNDKSFNFKINDFTLSPDGKHLVTATERNMFVWCLEHYRLVAHHINWDGVAEKIYFTPDSQYYVTLINDIGSWQNTIQVWKSLSEFSIKWEWINDEFDFDYTQSSMRELTPSLSYLFSSLVNSCYGEDYNFYTEFYSHDFCYKVSCSKDILSLYSMNKPLVDESSILVEEIELCSEVEVLTFSYDSKLIVLSQEEDIEVFSTQDLKQLKILESHKEQVTALATSRDNNYLVSASKDQTLKLWSLESFELLATIENGLQNKITAIEFSIDSKKIFASSKEGIKIWDLATQKPLYHLFNDEAVWCQLDGEGSLIQKGIVIQ